MRIDHHREALLLNPDFVAPALSPTDKETLLRREPADQRRPRLAFQGLHVSQVGDARPGQISDRFAQDQFPVVRHAGFDEVVVELIYNALSSLVKTLSIFRSPPVLETPLLIVL